MRWIIILLLIVPAVFAQCLDPADGMTIDKSINFCGDVYDIPNGITITGNNIVVDCNGAILRGNAWESQIGLRIENSDSVTLRNCNILTFDQALLLKNVTNSLIEQNSFLKNRIGMRLMNAFENTIRDNNDKSREVPVSAVNSKFNVVMLSNRNIDRAFCEVNSCNKYKDMKVCVSGDFYCSTKCSAAMDNDCAPAVVLEPEPKVRTVEDIVEEARLEIEQPPIPVQQVVEEKRTLPLNTKLLIYLALYILAFIIIRVTKKR